MPSHSVAVHGLMLSHRRLLESGEVSVVELNVDVKGICERLDRGPSGVVR